MAQDSKKGNYANVTIDYLVASDKIPGGSTLIKNLPDGIDMNTYPDASIMIKVKVSGIKKDHVIRVCNDCVLNDYYGFSKTTASRPLLKNINAEYTVKYTYNEENLKKNLPSSLKISLYIYHKNSNQRQEPIEEIHSQQSFVLLPPRAIVPSSNKQVSTKTKEEETYWKNIQAQEEQEEFLYKRRNLYEKYLKKYPDGKYAKNAKLKIKYILEREEAWKNRKSAKELKEIAEAFSISEEPRKREGDKEIITSRISHYPGYAPSIIQNCPNTIVIDTIVKFKSEMKVVIIAPLGIDCSISAIIEKLGLPEGKKEIPVNTLIDPVTAEFEKLGDAVSVKVSGGAGPYDVRLIKGKKISRIIPKIELDEDSVFILKKDNKYVIDPGPFTLLVVDKSGHAREEARSKDHIFKGRISLKYILSEYGLYAFLLFMCLGVVGVYLRVTKQNNLSESEEENIEKTLEEIKKNSGKEKMTLKPKLEGNIRQDIIISKKTVNILDQSANTLVSTAPPKIHEVNDSPMVNSLLMGNKDEYRNLKLDELWEKTCVSNIYMREIFAYRINEFVFHENKLLLEAKGKEIPEIGGWIMGKVVQNQETGKYLVSFERFIKIQRHQHTTTQLTFDAYAWKELERAKDMYRNEDLEVVGWFHTHPGWGVFLSGKDINSHETFFAEPYHVAMELESVRPTHEVGFFTRWKSKGRMELNKESQNYYQWLDFQKWLGSA